MPPESVGGLGHISGPDNISKQLRIASLLGIYRLSHECTELTESLSTDRVTGYNFTAENRGARWNTATTPYYILGKRKNLCLKLTEIT
jgi:hypothetical protein